MKDLAALRGETGSWYHLPLGLLFEISDDHTCPLYMGLPPREQISSDIKSLTV